jgi:autotransporter-associated beta strand protein
MRFGEYAGSASLAATSREKTFSEALGSGRRAKLPKAFVGRGSSGESWFKNRNSFGKKALALGVLVGAASPVMAATTLRIGEYNIDCSDQGNNNAVSGASAGIPEVIQAMGQHHLGTNAQPVDVMMLTELLDTNNNSITSSTLPALVNSLNSIYGAGTYAYDTTPDPTSGGTQFNGPSGLIYNTKTVQVIGAQALPYGSYPRAPMRYELAPVGAGSSADFYVYVSHMKSGTSSSDVNERAAEGAAIRANEATLPASASVLYTGDYNTNPPEAVFTTMTAAGQGQAFDPVNFSTASKYLSESTSSLKYRDDYEMMTSNVLNDTGPVDYVSGSFQVFGNNGTTPVNGATNLLSNTSLNDLPNATAILNDLMQPYGSDHMPVVADYSIATGPVTLTWTDFNGTGTGVTWDTTSQNWNNGTAETVYSDGNNSVFNDNNNGNYAVSVTGVFKPLSTVINNSLGDYSFTGTGGIGGTGALSKSGTGTATLSTVNTYSGGTNVSAGALVVGVNGALPNGAVSVSGGVLQLGVGTGLASVSSLAISGSGQVDVANNHVIVSYGSSDPISTVIGYVASGEAGGAWNGNGIISSVAAVTPGYGVAVVDGADKVVAGLPSGEIEIAYALLGDLNLDGVVNGTDFGILAGHFGQSVTGGWDDGDLNYDGIVNGTDFGELAQNFGKSASGVAVTLPASEWAALDSFAAAHGFLADVPEPGAVGVLLLLGGGVVGRRRRRA